MRYELELQIEKHWYPVATLTESESAAQAVAHGALMEGIYRARPAGRSDAGYELFSVPAWGEPIALR